MLGRAIDEAKQIPAQSTGIPYELLMTLVRAERTSHSLTHLGGPFDDGRNRRQAFFLRPAVRINASIGMARTGLIVKIRINVGTARTAQG